MIKNTDLISGISDFACLPSGMKADMPNPPIIDKGVMIKGITNMKCGFVSLPPGGLGRTGNPLYRLNFVQNKINKTSRKCIQLKQFLIVFYILSRSIFIANFKTK